MRPVVYVVVLLTVVVVPLLLALLKGRYWMALLVVVPFVGSPIWWVAACRLARPKSVWYRRWYDEAQQERSRERFA